MMPPTVDLSWIGLGAAALLTLVLVVKLILRQPAEPRIEARRLVARGRPVSQVARRLGLSQDAVRLLLQPDPTSRSVRVGKSFRETPHPRVKRVTAASGGRRGTRYRTVG